MPTIPPNNNTGLYGIDGSSVAISNDVTVDNLAATGNITAGGYIAAQGNITSQGNISADYFIGDGSQLTNLPPGDYSNANVVALMATFGSNTIVTTGNITGGYIFGNGSQLTGLPATYGNSNVTTLLANFGSNTVSTTGNVTAGYFIGDGSQLTGLPASYGNANVAAFLPTYTGNLAGGNLSIGNDAVISNDLTVGGTIYGTFAGNISGNLVVPGSNTQVIFNKSGNAGASANFTFNEATNIMTVNGTANVGTLNATGNVTGGNIAGNGAGLSAITGANVTGTVANATFATSAATATTASTANSVAGANVTGTVASATQANTANVANSVSGSNVVGAVANATFATSAASATTAGTVTTNAQPNITSVGTLSTLSVSGNIATGGILTDGYYYANGTPVTFGGGGTYGNANVANFLANYGSNTVVTTGNISGGNVIGTFLYGDGSNITGVVAGAASTRIAVKNTSGGTLTKGTPVYATGTVGASTIIEIAASRADTAATMPCMGLLAQDLNNNDQGYSISVGTLTGANTNAFVTGRELYVATTGGLTTSRPTGTNVVQTLGFVGRVDSSNGSIEVNIWNINSLPNLGNGNVWIGNATGYPTESVAYGNSNVTTLLAAFGSNTISTTGNVTAGNINSALGVYAVTIQASGLIGGNGSPLTSLTGANVVGAVANATYATSAGTATSATTAGTVTTNAQPNITSVGTLTSLNVSGNTTSGNLSATGTVKSGAVTYTGTDGTTGQVLTTYGNGQTYFSTVSGGSYGNANVANYLASGTLSSNIITTANVTASGMNTSGPSGNITGVNYLYANSVVANVSLQSGAVTYTPTDGTAGQVLTTYGNGITYFSTVASGGNTPGGSNTQIQFNDGGAFGGNATMTFDKATGNVVLGNIVTNTNNMQTVGAIDYPNVTASANVVPWRITMGNAYNGSANSSVVNTSPGTIGSTMNTPRLLVSDLVTVPNNGMRINEAAFVNWAIPTANISNNSTRIVASRSEMMVGGSVNNYAITGTSPFILGAHTSQVYIGAGTNANLSGVGNIVVSGGAIGMFVGVNTQPGSSVAFSTGALSQIVATDSGGVFGNATNTIAYTTHMSGNPANANVTGTTTAVGYYQPPNSTTGVYGSGLTTGNIARSATNYHAFRNDDDLARSRLGALERMHYLTANVTSSSGSVTIDKNNGQVQQVYLTEAITGATFSNFAVRQQRPNATFQNSTDVVTVIFQQGATPYNITLPTGNAAIRYANGVSSVTGVANTTVMVDVVGVYNYNTSATNYLIEIKPTYS
ncbi:hypothetical protein UFOVP849_33 [uncultured Caudovirales phage]|uniref:Chlorovirus glycoprotein repeat domain-containing protein n=1 Tax=uncultured Caudovirales phage TaxID=2100421 RepID=A0A6J5P3A3_9CAUD|nr:hypothetical protein UFOVP849_33 [uncultured Caudovirales phage]